MPTQHVESESHDLLQDVANALLKARKVVVVTGAGISTNSGIPDFRSENGLYSLIQAQYDAAVQQSGLSEREQADAYDSGEEGHREKRRRISVDDSANRKESAEEFLEEMDLNTDAISAEPELPVTSKEAKTREPEAEADSDALEPPLVRTPQSKLPHISTGQPSTSPLSSPPAEDDLLLPISLQPSTHKRLIDVSHTIASSPLSSPPPVLFDPFPPSSPSDTNISRRSSTTPSEVDESQTSLNAFTASQSSNSGRSSLPNMKGKDLFDASIWSDPARTSVFYQFATSLRQKVRDAEPTSSHKFISHLRDRGKLVRCYTQNIDQIEEKVGLSTTLQDGPGSRGRFSRRSTANTTQLNKMVEEASGSDSNVTTPADKSSQSTNDESSGETSISLESDVKTEVGISQPDQTKTLLTQKRDPPRSGVECVFLHGSLERLRCFLCGRVCSWDDEDRVMETLSGQQPECPHCVGATEARQERGKRALGVGKLRPDIVLYGEEHPNAHLISPIVTHDLALYPDMLLILGTSLRVHGLKVMVREFAKTVHSKGGKVVFINFTKPPESSWGEIIDYWIQWDCDAWVADLQVRIPKLWQAPEPPKPKKKRESGGASEDGREEKKRPPAANPVALRDTKVNGAYCTLKIIKELHRITGVSMPPDRRASIAVANPAPTTDESMVEGLIGPIQNKALKAKSKRPRKSAPATLEKPKRTSSTLNPNHGRRKKPAKIGQPLQSSDSTNLVDEFNSILHSVKSNPRKRKRKIIDGVEVEFPTVGKRPAGSSSLYRPSDAELKLPPLRPEVEREPASPYGKPEPLEPTSPPAGPPSAPLASLSVNLRAAMAFDRPETFYLYDPLVRYLEKAPELMRLEPAPAKTKLEKNRGSKRLMSTLPETKAEAEANAALALAGLRTGSPVMNRVAHPMPGNFQESELMSWGATWNCTR